MITNGIIERVDPDKDYYTVSVSEEDKSSFGFGLSTEWGVEPKKGDKIAVEVTGGSTVRGVWINNKKVFYKTDEDLENDRKKWLADREKEEKEEFEKNKYQMDKDYDALPMVFKLRIDRFRRGNPRFREKFEPYELFVCKEAIRIAEHCGTPEKIEEFAKSDDRFAFLDEGHSGNSAGMAIRLAYVYLQNPDMVTLEHGALVQLVGCEEYGCTHDFGLDG